MDGINKTRAIQRRIIESVAEHVRPFVRLTTDAAPDGVSEVIVLRCDHPIDVSAVVAAVRREARVFLSESELRVFVGPPALFEREAGGGAAGGCAYLTTLVLAAAAAAVYVTQT